MSRKIEIQTQIVYVVRDNDTDEVVLTTTDASEARAAAAFGES